MNFWGFSIIICGLFFSQVFNAQELDWALHLVNSSEASSNQAFDLSKASNGDVLIVGIIEGQVDMDPGTDEYFLGEMNGFSRYYFARYSPEGGFLWAKALNPIESTLDPILSPFLSISSDSLGHIYITGNHSTPMDFDTSPSQIFLGEEGNAMFLAKYDGDGELIWLKERAVQNPAEQVPIAKDLQVSPDGEKIFLAGRYYGDVDVGLGDENHMLEAQGHGLFIAQYHAEGTISWAHGISGQTSYSDVQQIKLSQEGDVHLCGFARFDEQVDLAPGPEEFHLTSSALFMDLFLAKFSSEGELTWARNMDIYGEGIGHHCAMDIDSEGGIYLTGDYNTPADFDPGPNQNLLQAVEGNSPGFVAKYDAEGNHQWATNMDGALSPMAIGIKDGQGLYVAGSISGAYFQTDSIQTWLATSLNSAFSDFVARFDLNGTNCWAHAIGNNGFGGTTLDNYLIPTDQGFFITGTFKQTGNFSIPPDEFELSVHGPRSHTFLARYQEEDHLLSPRGDWNFCDEEILKVEFEDNASQILWPDGSTGNFFYPTTDFSSIPIEAWFQGCVIRDTIVLGRIDCELALEMPNVFSPNGDGVNDHFVPRNIKGYHQAIFKIYNRWGNLLFESSEPKRGWDGTANGTRVSEGVYYWHIDLMGYTGERISKSGHLMLLR